MLELKREQFGVGLMGLVGICGEFPMTLLREVEGYYDYNRRVVTELVKEGYLKERKLQGYERHVVRTLSLTEKGLSKIQKENPGAARLIRGHYFSPGDGQGDWKKTLRLHRNAHCLMTAMQLGAIWYPGKERDNALGSKLTYYSAYELNRKFGRDSKGSRTSGVLFGPSGWFFPVCYLGKRNMMWNPETERMFRNQVENDLWEKQIRFGGTILLGDDWDMITELFKRACNPRSRMIRFSHGSTFYYVVRDHYGQKLLRLIVDDYERDKFTGFLNKTGIHMGNCHEEYLYNFDILLGYYRRNSKDWRRITPGSGRFFDFQMKGINDLCNTEALLIKLPSRWLDEYDKCE